MVESPQMTRLEAAADVPLAPRAVWAAILDGSRWPDWMASGDARGNWSGGGPRLTLDHVSPFLRPSGGRDGVTCAVGDIRHESALVSRPFGLGARRVEWHSIVTDIDDGTSIEIASPAVGGLREWRLRVTILPTGVQPLPSWFRLAPPVDRDDGVRQNEREPVGNTRVRAILTYRPVGVFSRLYDRLSLRSMVQARLEAWIAGLARSLSILADLESRAVSDPIRYLPAAGRPATAQRGSLRATGQYPVVRGGTPPAEDLAATALLRTVRGLESDPSGAAVTLNAPAAVGPGRAAEPADGVAASADPDGPPVPARAVPDVMPAPALLTPVAVKAPVEAPVAAVGASTSGAPRQAAVTVEVAPAEPVLPVAPAAKILAGPPAEPVVVAAQVTPDASLPVRDEPASTPPEVPVRVPAPAVAARTTDGVMPAPARVDPDALQPVASTGAMPSLPRPVFYGEARPTTISASAMAASRRLAAMAANRPVTGLGGAVARPASSTPAGVGANQPGLVPATSDGAVPTVTVLPVAPGPVPTIGAVAEGSRASAAVRGEALAPASVVADAIPPASVVADAIPPASAVPSVPEGSAAKPVRDDGSPASSDAAA
jgi:hypothetical protein